MLTVIRQTKDAEPAFFCGCFTGNETALRKYISDHEPEFARTRLLAMTTALALLDEKN
jgi:hypothetical protein